MSRDPDTHLVAWEGWSVRVPVQWNPVRIDLNHWPDGTLLLADLHDAKLGLRWSTLVQRKDPAAAVDRVLRDEIGQLAAAEAVDARDVHPGLWTAAKLYVDPDPPGRDVFVGHSKQSGRLLRVVHHAAGRSDAFVRDVLPTLAETPASLPRQWAVYDFTFQTPPHFGVTSWRLNAGDLSVTIARDRANFRQPRTLRQISPATLALARRPLARWCNDSPTGPLKAYRPAGEAEPVAVDVGGRPRPGLMQTFRKRRRLFWFWSLPTRQCVIATHDADRDVLLIASADTETVARDVVGTANTPAD